MKRISEEMERLICEDYKTGTFSSRELGIKYSLSKTTILRVLKRNNIPVINRRLVNLNLNEEYFKTIDSEEKAYFLGFIFADGCVSNDELFIDIHEKDKEILLKFRECINSQAKITTRIKGKSSMCRIAIKNKNFTSHLAKFGIIPNKTKNTHHLPIHIISKQYYSHFLRGLIDGDGWVIKTKEGYYRIGFVTQYQSTAQDFVFIMNNLIEDKWNNKVVIKKEKCATIQIQKQKQVKQLATALYMNSNIHLSRKFQVAQEIFDSKC